MTNYEDLLRTRRVLIVGVPVLVIAAAAGLAAVTSNDTVDTLLGMVAGALTVVVVALVLAMVWRARHPVVGRPVAGRPVLDRQSEADRAALDALEPLRAARDDR